MVTNMVTELLNRNSAAELLRSHLPFFQEADRELLSLRIRDVRLDRSFQAQYECRIRNNGTQSYRILVCQVLPPRKFPSSARKLKRQLARLEASDPALGSFFLEAPDKRLLVSAFPLDSSMKHLGQAVDPELAVRTLAEHAPELQRRIGRLTDCEIAVARYVAGRRCQIEYRLKGERGRETLLGKTFKDSRGRELFTRMQQVALLFSKSGISGITAPRSTLYLPKWRMVLQEFLSGVTLHDLIQAGRAEDRHMALAASCLHVLHSGSLDLEHTHLVQDELALIRKCYQRIEELGLGGIQFARVLEELLRFSSRLHPTRSVPVHRDFYEKQILIDGSTAALLDLDTLSWGCAEIDLGNFIAHLELSSLLKPGLATRHWEQIFIENYCSLAPALDSEALRFFTATTLFRLACRRRLHSCRRGRPSSLLGLAGTRLESPAASGFQKSVLPC